MSFGLERAAYSDTTVLIEGARTDLTPNTLTSLGGGSAMDSSAGRRGFGYDPWTSNHTSVLLLTDNGTSAFANTSGVSFLDSNSSTVTAAPGPSLHDYTIFTVAYYMNRYYLWVIFAFGFPGNIVSFITVLRMKPFTSPTGYVAALALVDNACLVFKLLFFLLTKYDAELGHAGCRTLLFLGTFSSQFANWLLVAMTVERCLAICLPLKVGTICTRKLHVGGLVLIAVVLVALNSQHFVTSAMVVSGDDFQCDSSEDYTDFLKVWFWVDAMVYAILPAMLLIIMNTLIILGIRRSAKIQRELTNHKVNHVEENIRQQRQITIMLVVICIAFVLLITPNALFYAVKLYWSYEPNTLEHAKFLFTNQLIFVLSDSTHAVNFYLYFFSTRRFRKRCLETVFFCCLQHHRRSRRFRASSISGMSKTYRLSMTDVTSAPAQHQALQLTHLSSSSSSSSCNNQHLLLHNGEGRHSGKFRGHRDGSF